MKLGNDNPSSMNEKGVYSLEDCIPANYLSAVDEEESFFNNVDDDSISSSDSLYERKAEVPEENNESSKVSPQFKLLGRQSNIGGKNFILSS